MIDPIEKALRSSPPDLPPSLPPLRLTPRPATRQTSKVLFGALGSLLIVLVVLAALRRPWVASDGSGVAASSTMTPSPVISESPHPSDLESTVAPTMSPSAFVSRVVVEMDARHSLRITIEDQSGLLESARPATLNEMEAVQMPPSSDIVGVNLGKAASRTVELRWIGSLCDRTATLAIAQHIARMAIFAGPRPGCDAVGVDHGLVLTFAEPIDVGTVELALVTP
jgi:hypothetical protein